MIRKDQLPKIWNDGWRCDAEPRHLTVKRGEEVEIVVCNEGDAPLFMLKADDGSLMVPDGECLDILVEPEAHLRLWRLQATNTPDNHITQTDITMQEASHLNMCTVTLGGHHVRNNVVVRMKGEGCECAVGGLYLVDRDQECDNYVFVEHAAAHCISRELYKGIVDDSAKARFNGHVLVQDGAEKTEAQMTNRNILLTDKAHVETRPFLEIYNDDVKCSHGSTIGQLDEQAMFYLMTRGISQKTAVTMLSYAFCDEVISSIGLDEHKRNAIGDMVKKRLHGELSPSCDECAIRCSSPCNGEVANFRIDPDKL